MAVEVSETVIMKIMIRICEVVLLIITYLLYVIWGR